MLSTTKEMTDTSEGNDKRDMTRAPKIRGIFRTLTLKLGRAKVPMLITNHTYEVIGSYIPTKEMSGGSGLKYAASNILFLSKKIRINYAFRIRKNKSLLQRVDSVYIRFDRLVSQIYPEGETPPYITHRHLCKSTSRDSSWEMRKKK